MYKEDLALNTLQLLIPRKNKTKQKTTTTTITDTPINATTTTIKILEIVLFELEILKTI